MSFQRLLELAWEFTEHIWAYIVWSKPFVCSSPPPGVWGCSLVLSVQALYSSSDDVVELTPSNFNREVIQSDSLWLVEFYAPWWVLTTVITIIQR